MKLLPLALAFLAAAFADPRTADLLVRNAQVVQGDGRVIPRAVIVVSAGRITRIAAGGGPWRARREIDAAGRTVIPGLIDAHVHVSAWALPLLLRAGVTTVRDVHNDLAFVMGLAAGDAPDVPRILAAGPAIDGAGTDSPNAVVVETVADARAVVRVAAGQGASVIATAPRLHQALLSVIVAEAAARGVPVAAQLGKTNAIEAADAGITSLEQLSGIADAASDDPERLRRLHDDRLAGWTASAREWLRLDAGRLQTVMRRLLEHEVALVPTLVQFEAMARLDDPSLVRGALIAGVPRAVVEREWDPRGTMTRAAWTPDTLTDLRAVLPILQRFVAEYVRRGGRVAAGTDTPQPFVTPGRSLHRELQLYVAGGVAPAAALQSATSGAAALLGIAERTGTIDVGKDADLVLLDGDPLRDIRATERVLLVIKRGVVVYER